MVLSFLQVTAPLVNRGSLKVNENNEKITKGIPTKDF